MQDRTQIEQLEKEKVKEIIKRLKNNKSPKESGIITEILTKGGKSLEQE